LAGWLHTEISVRHREVNPDTVAHLGTNPAQRRLTLLIKANALTTRPDHQTTNINVYRIFLLSCMTSYILLCMMGWHGKVERAYVPIGLDGQAKLA